MDGNRRFQKLGFFRGRERMEGGNSAELGNKLGFRNINDAMNFSEQNAINM
jgi:hypothetical protein